MKHSVLVCVVSFLDFQNTKNLFSFVIVMTKYLKNGQNSALSHIKITVVRLFKNFNYRQKRRLNLKLYIIYKMTYKANN